jgi:membrane protein YdbS with pleckstrin-like domain
MVYNPRPVANSSFTPLDHPFRPARIMLCPTCKTTAPDDSAFCPKCGQRLVSDGITLSAERLKAGARPAATEPEQQLWHGSYSAKAMYGSWLLAGVATLMAVVVSIFVPTPVTWLVAGVIVAALWVVSLAYYMIERLSIDYTLTTQRFVHQKGLLRRVTNRIEVIDIDDVTVEQGFFERMFGVGTIKLLSSDTSDPSLVLRGIDDCKRVASMIDDTRRDERRKRGMFIESV